VEYRYRNFSAFSTEYRFIFTFSLLISNPAYGILPLRTLFPCRQFPHLRVSRIVSPRLCSRSTSSATHPRSGLPIQCTNSSTYLPRLTIPTNPLRPPLIPLPLHLVLTTRIPSAFFNGTQMASLHPDVPNSVLFLSTNRYDLVLLQETNLSRSRNFNVSGYFVFRADRTLTRRGPATAGTQNGRGVLILINSDLSFQMAPSLPSPTQPLTISVLKSTSRSYPLFSSSMSTSLPAETLNSTSHLFL